MEGPEVDTKLLQELKHCAHAPEGHLQLAQRAVFPRPHLTQVAVGISPACTKYCSSSLSSASKASSACTASSVIPQELSLMRHCQLKAIHRSLPAHLRVRKR